MIYDGVQVDVLRKEGGQAAREEDGEEDGCWKEFRAGGRGKEDGGRQKNVRGK